MGQWGSVVPFYWTFMVKNVNLVVLKKVCWIAWTTGKRVKHWSVGVSRRTALVLLPVIRAHPPVKEAHRPIAQTSSDERTLWIAGQTGHTTVRSGRDVLDKHTGKMKESEKKKQQLANKMFNLPHVDNCHITMWLCWVPGPSSPCQCPRSWPRGRLPTSLGGLSPAPSPPPCQHLRAQSTSAPRGRVTATHTQGRRNDVKTQDDSKGLKLLRGPKSWVRGPHVAEDSRAATKTVCLQWFGFLIAQNS